MHKRGEDTTARWLLRLSVLGLGLWVGSLPPVALAQSTAIAPIQVVSPEAMTAVDPSVDVAAEAATDPLEQAPEQALNQAPEQAMEQVTAVSQLGDVEPTDWAFQALQSLVERYGCLAGYPDQTFRGNRAIARAEFAAGLNACIDRVNERIATATGAAAKSSDLVTLRQLQAEFAAELSTLRGRVDALAVRTANLERQQFSTTTKLSGFVAVGLQQRFSNRGDRNPRDGVKDTQDPGTEANLISHAYLGLTTLFSPRDFLFAGLWQQKGSGDPSLTQDGRLSYDFGEFDLYLSDLNYHFMIGDRFAAVVGTDGVYTSSVFRGPNRQESLTSGPLSFFAQRNPVLNIGLSRGGVAFDWQFAKRASLQAIYATDIPGFLPNQQAGPGHNTGGVQLALTPTDQLDVTVYYINDYSPNGMLLGLVGDDALVATNPVTGNTAPLQTNAYGLSADWQLTPKLTLGGWFGYTNSYIPGAAGRVETANYMVYLNFLDLFGKGNLGGIYIGQPPKITRSNLPLGFNVPDSLDTGLGRPGGQPGTSTHVEVFYRWQVNDQISVTPGVMMIFNPGHTPQSDPVMVGAVRTVFSF